MSDEPADETQGLRRFQTGAAFGLAGGVVGLVLPVSIILLAYYDTSGTIAFNATLLGFTSLLVLVGTLLLAISLIYYRFGFGSLRRWDPWFLVPTILCNIGSIGFFLLIAAVAFALPSTPSLVQCIQNSPTSTLTCLQAIQPLTAYSVVAGFWLAWIGGVGIVLGLELGGRRYQDPHLVVGGAAYAVLLLVLVAPFIALLFPVGGWQYPLVTLPLVALIAPAYVYVGSYRAVRNGVPVVPPRRLRTAALRTVRTPPPPPLPGGGLDGGSTGPEAVDLGSGPTRSGALPAAAGYPTKTP